ncbi:MAG: hypothetical protein M3256_04845 [Actinomycetota bacterium]|nr:hypothetical protein [Candidatus Dormibacteraeota bacterium]MDQ6945600.1 hypothetical protein [Actinomycetota bacterium]
MILESELERLGIACKHSTPYHPQTCGKVAGHGILAATFAGKLRSAAAIAIELGDLESLVSVRVAQAKRVLQRFPGIGEPGADRILLFGRLHAVPALDSNGSRALQRLLSVSVGGSYARVYRAETALIAAGLRADFDGLIEAYQLLRRHGQELCRRKVPLCDGCPLRDGCDYYVRLGSRLEGSPGTASAITPWS